MCMYCCTDDRDDGMGLPVQLPPTDDERATMCVCKPRPTFPTPTPIPIPIPTPTPTPTPLMPTPSPSMPTPSPALMPSSTPTPTPSLNFTVMFNASKYSGDEADGVIAVTVVATGVSPEPYNVTITTSEHLPVSARELYDYLNETIVVTFNPGETEQTMFIVINSDCTREGSEFFNLTLSLDPAAMDLGITLGDPSMAVAEIRDTDSKQLAITDICY